MQIQQTVKHTPADSRDKQLSIDTTVGPAVDAADNKSRDECHRRHVMTNRKQDGVSFGVAEAAGTAGFPQLRTADFQLPFGRWTLRTCVPRAVSLSTFLIKLKTVNQSGTFHVLTLTNFVVTLTLSQWITFV